MSRSTINASPHHNCVSIVIPVVQVKFACASNRTPMQLINDPTWEKVHPEYFMLAIHPRDVDDERTCMLLMPHDPRRLPVRHFFPLGRTTDISSYCTFEPSQCVVLFYGGRVGTIRVQCSNAFEYNAISRFLCDEVWQDPVDGVPPDTPVLRPRSIECCSTSILSSSSLWGSHCIRSDTEAILSLPSSTHTPYLSNAPSMTRSEDTSQRDNDRYIMQPQHPLNSAVEKGAMHDELHDHIVYQSVVSTLGWTSPPEDCTDAANQHIACSPSGAASSNGLPTREWSVETCEEASHVTCSKTSLLTAHEDREVIAGNTFDCARAYYENNRMGFEQLCSSITLLTSVYTKRLVQQKYDSGIISL